MAAYCAVLTIYYSSPLIGGKRLKLFLGNPSQSYVRSVTRRMGSHIVTCHPTQVNAPHLNPSQTGHAVLDLFTPEGWTAELTLMLVIYRDGLPVRCSNHLITTRSGVKLTTSQSQVTHPSLGGL